MAVSCECCVLSGRSFYVGLITSPEDALAQQGLWRHGRKIINHREDVRTFFPAFIVTYICITKRKEVPRYRQTGVDASLLKYQVIKTYACVSFFTHSQRRLYTVVNFTDLAALNPEDTQVVRCRSLTLQNQFQSHSNPYGIYVGQNYTVVGFSPSSSLFAHVIAQMLHTHLFIYNR